jgi:hypothetical protein
MGLLFIRSFDASLSAKDGVDTNYQELKAYSFIGVVIVVAAAAVFSAITIFVVIAASTFTAIIMASIKDIITIVAE